MLLQLMLDTPTIGVRDLIYLSLLHSTMTVLGLYVTQLHSSYHCYTYSLRYTLLTLYLTQLDTTTLYHGSNWLYYKLH